MLERGRSPLGLAAGLGSTLESVRRGMLGNVSARVEIPVPG